MNKFHKHIKSWENVLKSKKYIKDKRKNVTLLSMRTPSMKKPWYIVTIGDKSWNFKSSIVKATNFYNIH